MARISLILAFLCTWVTTTGGLFDVARAADVPAPPPAAVKLPSGDYWVEPMRQVHRAFKGNRGRCTLYGDSITYSMAFLGAAAWGKEIPCRNVPPNAKSDLDAVWAYADRAFWQKRDPSLGQQGSMKSDWFLANVDRWQKSLKPEACVILFGTNDLGSVPPARYEQNMSAAIERILQDGTVPMLTTVPPANGRDRQTAEYYAVSARLAERFKIPVIDFYGEILRRRPDDWNGALPKHLERAKDQKGRVDVYAVLAPISGDGVHPSNPKEYRADFSEHALNNNGFILRDYLTLRMYGAVIRKVFLADAGAPGASSSEKPAPSITRPILFNTPEADAILENLQVFPPDNPWNQDISKWPLHPNSAKLIASIGPDKPMRYNPDMAFVLVPPDQKRIDLKTVSYPDESDPGPFPIPDNTPIEGWPSEYTANPKLRGSSLEDVQRDAAKLGGDRHAIIVDPVNRMLYEFYQMRRIDGGWQAAQSSIFDLKSNRLRPDGWTSSDAAGLPVFPAVVRYDEIKRGIVAHAMRVTVRRTRRAYIAPATHFASRLTDPNLPRMGERLRLRQDYPIDGFSAPVQAILKGLKKYGMFVADNGIDWAISVAPDQRIPVLHEELRRIKGSAFEVVQMPQ